MTYAPGDAGHYDDFPLPMSHDRPPKRRRAGRIALVSMALVAITVVAGVVVVRVLPRRQSENTAGFHPTANSPSGDAEQIAVAFLRAWSSGNLGEAAGLTDDP